MIFQLLHRPPKMNHLGLTLAEANGLEEWEAHGLLRRLRVLQAATERALAGKRGSDDEEIQEAFEDDGTTDDQYLELEEV